MKSKSSVPKTKSTLLVAAAVLFALVALAAFGISSTAVPQPSPAVIAVVFTEDDMGFTVTSTKGISNIIVQYCDLSTHKHEAEFVGAELKVFSHTESQIILGIWVKSGNNVGDGPPGAGQRFDNVGATCSTATSTPPVTTSTTPPETTSSTPPVTTSTTLPETTSSTPPTAPPAPTTQIPFFPSSAALALATMGALGGAFLLMRRRN